MQKSTSISKVQKNRKAENKNKKTLITKKES